MKNTVHFTSLLLLFALGSPLAMLTGCKGGFQETVGRVRGQDSVMLEASYDNAVTAAAAALKDLEFRNIDTKRDALVALITALTAEDRVIDIRISRQSEKVTRLQIRVGKLGDESLQKLITDKIKARL